MHFAVRLKLAFSITLHLARCFDVFSKGQVDACMCVSEHVCSAGMHTHVRARAFRLSPFMCVGICLMCVQPYGAGR